MNKIKFETYDMDRNVPTYTAEDRIYTVERTGGLGTAYWNVYSLRPDLTSRPMRFPTIQAATAAARGTSPDEMRGVQKDVALIMMGLVCEAETADKWIFQDKDGDRWVLDKKTLEAQKIEEKYLESSGHVSQHEAIKSGKKIAAGYLEEKAERSKWAWNLGG